MDWRGVVDRPEDTREVLPAAFLGNSYIVIWEQGCNFINHCSPDVDSDLSLEILV